MLKNKFGFDDAFNYKEDPDLDAALKRSAATNVSTIIFHLNIYYRALVIWLKCVSRSRKENAIFPGSNPGSNPESN